MKNIEDKPWASWMEETIKKMVHDDVKKVIIVTFDANGTIRTGGSGTTVNDVALAGFWLTQTAMEKTMGERQIK